VFPATADLLSARSRVSPLPWTYPDSNWEPPPCRGGALPLELQALNPTQGGHDGLGLSSYAPLNWPGLRNLTASLSVALRYIRCSCFSGTWDGQVSNLPAGAPGLQPGWITRSIRPIPGQASIPAGALHLRIEERGRYVIRTREPACVDLLISNQAP
jgi:hypothetical protein